jgi:hypothetical protein
MHFKVAVLNSFVVRKTRNAGGFTMNVLRAALMLALTNLLSANVQAAMAPHELANTDWNAAVTSYKANNGDVLASIRKLRGYDSAAKNVNRASYIDQVFSADLQTINAISSTLRPNVFRAGSPVLLPIDLKRLINEMITSGEFDNKDRTRSYFGTLGSLAFYPGPYGYRAYFHIKRTSTVMVSGSSVFYKLSGAMSGQLPKIDSCGVITGIAQRASGNDEAADKSFYDDYLRKYGRRLGLIEERLFGEREATIPCLFAGSLVEVHILCDAEGDPDCRVRDIARLVMSRLAFVGGSPRSKANPAINDPLRKLDNLIDSLESDSENAGKTNLPAYAQPGDLLPGSGVKAASGSPDSHIYGHILFPTDVRAAAQTVIFRADQDCAPGDKDLGRSCIHNGFEITKGEVGRWRDNFCEDRDANRLYTCPVGSGHAGQDVWGGNWNKHPAGHPLWAVVDGVAFRRFPAQPAVTISDVYGSNIDYIYRHMRPSELKKHGVPSSSPTDVRQGCVLAFVDRLNAVTHHKSDLRDGEIYYEPTAPHLHFEIRVPTRSGFQNVSPYWTLVQSHKFQLTKVDTAPVNGPCGR